MGEIGCQLKDMRPWQQILALSTSKTENYPRFHRAKPADFEHAITWL